MFTMIVFGIVVTSASIDESIPDSGCLIATTSAAALKRSLSNVIHDISGSAIQSDSISVRPPASQHNPS